MSVVADPSEQLAPLVARFRAAGVLALLALLIVAGCAGSASQTPPVRIRLGTYEWPGSYWIDLAWKKGWFAESGLDVERVDTDGKYFESLDAVAAGKLDAMGFSQFDLVRYVAAGHDLVGVAAIDYSEGAEALIARPNIQRLHDLRGKRIALHRGTYLEYLLAIAVEREGLDLQDLDLIDCAAEESQKLLFAGKVDAIFVWEPFAAEAEAAVNGVRLFSTAAFPGLTYSVFSMRRDFLDAHPGEVQALLRIWKRAVQFIHDHPEESIRTVADVFQESQADIRNLMHTDRILGPSDNGRAFSYAAGFESLHGSWRRMNDFMVERGLVSRRIDSPAHLDPRFVRALD